MKLIKKLLGYCDSCRKYFKYPKRYRMICNYQNEEDNYTIECKACRIQTQDYWEEQYRDAYGSY